MSSGITPSLARAESPSKAEEKPARLGSKAQPSVELPARNALKFNSSMKSTKNQRYANPATGGKDANPAAPTDFAAASSSEAAAQAHRNWAELSEDSNSEYEGNFTIVQKRKRRRGSANSSPAAAPSSNLGGARTNRRPQSSAGWAPRAQEVRTTRAHIVEARARQASSTEDHCVYVERSPELEPYHYMRAMDRMFGSTREVFQVTKMNGHFLVGLANRGMAERLVNEGLEVEGTLHRVFPFRKRAERITVGNLPFFVGDAARPTSDCAQAASAAICPASTSGVPQPSHGGLRRASREPSSAPPPAALRPSPPAPLASPAEAAPPAPPPMTPAPSLRTPGSREPAAPTPDIEMSNVEESPPPLSPPEPAAVPPTPPLPAPQPAGPIPPAPDEEEMTPIMREECMVIEIFKKLKHLTCLRPLYQSGIQPDDLKDAILFIDERESLMARLTPAMRGVLAEFLSAAIEPARGNHPDLGARHHRNKLGPGQQLDLSEPGPRHHLPHHADKSNVHCVESKRNVIFERAQFNRRYQQDREAVEEYIRVLHKMAENCNYGSLKEEMIRDRIVVGVKNLQLSEKLQLEPNLTLERAIQAACQTECVKQQQTILRSTTTQAANVDQVYEKKLPPRRFDSTFGKGDTSKKSKFQKWSKPEKSGCIRCGASKFHPYKDCPAKEVKCHKCKKVGHFAKVCYNKTVGQVTQGDDYHFVGNIYENGQNSNDWKVYVKVDKIKILFKMDTGADVNIIPQEIYFKNFAHKKLCKPDIQLLGPRQVKLHVIGKFTALIEKDGRRLGTLQGSYTIKLKDESQPHAIYTPRRIPIPLLNKTKEQLDQMVEKGVIEKVEQPTDWCAPMVIVPKPSSNDLRICVDLTALNKFVKREHYPIPSVEYTLAQMGGAKLFSKLDANSGFWQIPLSEESSSLTTFLTPFGRYRFKRLPFGISSAPEVFQRKMSNLLESQSGVNCHMDDIVIWGATQEEHDERLRCVLRKLQDSGLTLNKEKCIFSVKEIKFLGHLITERGVLPDPNKVQAIREFPSPSSISEVRRFLGMVNFTGKFIPDLSTILYPLNQLLVKRNDWRWDSAQEEAFEKVKKLLSTSPTLTLFDPNLPTTVSADASSYGLGAVLLQKSEDGYQKAVAYASRTMSETEKRWAQIEKESLAIVWACERFQDYLMGNTFSIETDHKPLIPIFSTKNLDEMTPRIQRLRLRMMRYSYSIITHQARTLLLLMLCPEAQLRYRMRKIWRMKSGWPTKNELSAEAKAFWCLRYEISVIDGLLMRNSRIYIPKSLRSKVLNSLHEGHLGIEKCRGRARTSVWWPRISQEIGELVRSCPNCIEERSNPQQPLIVSDFPSRPWEKVGIDHFYLKGKYYLLIADYYSRFPELALLEDQTTHSTIMHCKSIFARHGIPEEVRSDNGPQFGLEFKKFAKEYGFHHITSSPRFPQSNGFIESMVKNIKTKLKKGRNPYLSLLGYRTFPLENVYSPAELCMNRKLRTTVPTSPVQLQSRIPDLENLEMREKDQRHKKKTHFDIHHRARELPHLDKGTRVWVKDLRVPGVVLEDAGSPRSYIVNSPKGILRRNIFHLLPNPQGEKIDMEDEEMESPEMSQCFTSTGDNTTCDSEPRTFQRSPEPVKTRSGRV
ncbi:K02A2.6-like, partial [Cordylochernes scorpioides]